MVLIMTNYFLCKLCIHTHTCTHTQNTHWCQNWAFMIMHWGLCGHTFSHMYNQCCIRHGTTWHQSVFCSHPWGFSWKFTIKHCWCICIHCSFPFIHTELLTHEVNIKSMATFNISVSCNQFQDLGLFTKLWLKCCPPLPPCGDLADLLELRRMHEFQTKTNTCKLQTMT